jgi:hypothetical protein
MTIHFGLQFIVIVVNDLRVWTMNEEAADIIAGQSS